MNQPKYVSILKMITIHSLTFFLLLQLSESAWIIKFMDCFEIMHQRLDIGEEFIFQNHTECYDENTEKHYLFLASKYILYFGLPLMILNFILLIISTIRLGFKWYLVFLSFLAYTIIARVINHFLPLSLDNFTFKVLLSIFNNVSLAVYLNIVLMVGLSLFIYFGKPVINFIKNEKGTMSNKDFEDILDIE